MVSSVMLPSIVESTKGSTSTVLVSLTVIVSVTVIYSTTGSSSEQFKNKVNRGKKISRFLFSYYIRFGLKGLFIFPNTYTFTKNYQKVNF